MQTIKDIDFGQLYLNHMQLGKHKPVPVERWDQRAPTYDMRSIPGPMSYTSQLMNYIGEHKQATVLDVGCGSGGVSMALAKQFGHVYAMDYSQGMLDEFLKRLDKDPHDNITLIKRSWEDDWSDLPEVDYIVASRSTVVMNLDAMLDKVIAKARKGVFMTMITAPFFFDMPVIRLLGLDQRVGLPTYIYAVNALYQRGIDCSVNFIQSDRNPVTWTADEYIEALEFSFGSITEEQKTTLRNAYHEINGKLYGQGQHKWALIAFELNK